MTEGATDDTSEKLFQLVYDELRALASSRLRHETPGQTLQPTALVHEVYMRLVASRKDQHWDSIGHFFAAAAESMRRILVDIARKKKNKPRKDATAEVILQLEGIREDITEDQLLQLDVALRRLESEDPEKAKIVVLRYFGGLSIEQICDAVGSSRTSVSRHLTFSRAWLLREMTREESSDSQE